MKERAVFYARVSTEKEEQESSLVEQIRYGREIADEKGWLLVDQYIDDGKTGTVVKGRDEYQRLMDDMFTDKFDIVVAKDQDRLQRNTKDWYIFVDYLVQTRKKLYLYLDGKFFIPGEDALITGIKAIMAEEYSRNLSKKINNYYKRRIEKAKKGEPPEMNSNGLCYGYDMVDGDLVINEEQAAVVRLIFKMYLSGKGAKVISRELSEQGIKNQRGRDWHPTTIVNIIKNERYKGTQVINKTHYDFDTKTLIKNDPSEWVHCEDRVPQIVSKEDWEKAHALLTKRRVSCGVDKQVATRGRNTGKSPLSGKIFCGECGEVYWRHYRSDNSESIKWRCKTSMTKGRRKKANGSGNPQGCNGRNLKEEELLEYLRGLASALEVEPVKEKIKADLEAVLKDALNRITNGGEAERLRAEAAKLETMKSRLLDKYLEGVIEDTDYKAKNDEIGGKLSRVKERLKAYEKRDQEIEEIKEALAGVDETVEKYLGSTAVEEDKLQFIIDHLTAVTVYPKGLVIDLDCLKVPVLVGKGKPGNEKREDAEKKQQKVQSDRAYFNSCDGRQQQCGIIDRIAEGWRYYGKCI